MGDIIKKNDIESFKELENNLLSINKGVKYTRDVEFEISIKYGLLCERYGKVLVEKYFSDNGIYLLDLDDQDLYVKVSRDLKSI